MRTNNIKVKITIPIPYNKPDINGNVYIKKAVQDAVDSLKVNLPIIFRPNNGEPHLLGRTTSDAVIVNWDTDKCECNITVEGIINYGGAETIVNKKVNDIGDNKIVIGDFNITAIGLSE